MRFLAAWLIYILGDAINRISYDPIAGVLYRPYNWLMLGSEAIQGDGAGPWQKAKSNEIEGGK